MIPKETIKIKKTAENVTIDHPKDSNQPTSKFSQMMLVGASAVSTAVNLNLFQNKYFLEQIWHRLALSFHFAALISLGSSKTTNAYMCFKSS